MAVYDEHTAKIDEARSFYRMYTMTARKWATGASRHHREVAGRLNLAAEYRRDAMRWSKILKRLLDQA